MILDLTHFRQGESTLSRRYDPPAFDGRSSQFRVVAPVVLQATVHKDKNRFRLVGTLTATLQLACSRCLEAFELPVGASFDLALPMKPLCREDCRGLCASCGANLNEETCDCQVRWEDPRLAGLKAVVTRNNDDA